MDRPPSSHPHTGAQGAHRAGEASGSPAPRAGPPEANMTLCVHARASTQGQPEPSWDPRAPGLPARGGGEAGREAADACAGPRPGGHAASRRALRPGWEAPVPAAAPRPARRLLLPP